MSDLVPMDELLYDLAYEHYLAFRIEKSMGYSVNPLTEDTFLLRYLDTMPSDYTKTNCISRIGVERLPAMASDNWYAVFSIIHVRTEHEVFDYYSSLRK